MSQQQLDSLIHMVNQIAANNGHHGSDEAAAGVVATHLKKFWARSMKRQIIDYVSQDGSRITPLARLAVIQLAETTSTPTATAPQPG